MAIGEIIGAGLGLIGSLFGKKKQKTESTVNYQQMVASAEAAGFNPLTALRNGGSAGFTTTTSPTVSQIPDALANFGGVLGSALEKRLDPIEAKKREIDTLMTDVQLKEARALSKRPASFYQPVEWSGTKVSNQFVPRLGAKSHQQAASIAGAVGGKSANSKNEPLDMFVEGRGLNGEKLITVNPNLADADQFLVPVLSQWLTSGRNFSRSVKDKANAVGDAVGAGLTSVSGAWRAHQSTRRVRVYGRGAMSPPPTSGGGGY